MQAATVWFTGPLRFKGTTKSAVPRILARPRRTVFTFPMALAAAGETPVVVDYSSPSSVFPAEACDTIGGEACDVEMFPEVKPTAASVTSPRASGDSEEVDREYIDYNEPKTVFPGEACDDLGGEFCEPDYQKDVYK